MLHCGAASTAGIGCPQQQRSDAARPKADRMRNPTMPNKPDICDKVTCPSTQWLRSGLRSQACVAAAWWRCGK
eukprot:4778098-Prymnesium_polylepis.1